MEISLNKLLALEGAHNQGIATSMLRMVVSKIMPLAEKQVASVLHAVANASCAEAMSTYLKSFFNKSPSLWALRMLDATAKAPQGLLTGGWALLGDYDECLNTHAPSFDGQYCLMTACLAGEGGGGLCSRDHLESPQWMQLAQGRTPVRWQGGWSATLTALRSLASSALPVQVGVCVPSACGAADVTVMAKRVTQILAPQVADFLHLETGSCQVADTQVFAAADFFALFLLFGLFLIVAASTAYDYAARGPITCRARLVLAFSAVRNSSRLLDAEASADELPALYALRAISVFWVTMHHGLLIAASLPLANGQRFIQELQRPSTALMTSGFLGLDTLLLLDGVLVSYVFLRRSVAGRPFSIAEHYAQRLARLLPSLALVLYLQSTIFLKLADGPLWNIQPSQQCSDTWPYILLQVCNYFRQESMKCLPYAWFLSLGWQLHLAAPLVLVLLRRSARRVQWALVAAAAAGLCARFALAFANGLHAPWGSFYTKEALKMLYFPTHVRFMPYFLGIALGYELHRIKHLEKPTLISKKTKGLMQITWPILMVGSLVSVHKFSVPSDQHPMPFLEALHLASVHITWALGVGIFVYLAATGMPTPGAHFLSFGEWRTLGRLAYGVLLLHAPFLNLLLYDTRFALHLSVWSQVVSGLLAYGGMLLPAAALWLLLQAPMGQLQAMLCNPPKGERKMLGKKPSSTEKMDYVHIPCEEKEESKNSKNNY